MILFFTILPVSKIKYDMEMNLAYMVYEDIIIDGSFFLEKYLMHAYFLNKDDTHVLFISIHGI